MSNMEAGRKKTTSSLLFQNDFVFQCSDNSDEEQEISPDVVDAIYAQMYFQSDTITSVSHHTENGKISSSTQLSASEMPSDFNVSLVMNDNSKKHSRKNKRRKEKKKKRVSSPLAGDSLEHVQSSHDDDAVIVITSSDESGLLSDDDSAVGSVNAESASSSEKGEADMALCSEDEDWKISLKDKMGREEYDRTYGGSRGGGGRFHGQKCNNCKQKGHFMKNCPWPKRHLVCYLCAGLNHISSKCPCDLCPYCYQTRHKGRSCKSPWANTSTQCSRCYMTGHHASICPDQWRQFHNTTYSSDRMFVIPSREQRSSIRVYCYNCGLQGHYGFECTRTRPRGWPLPHLLLVASYNELCWPPSTKRREDNYHSRNRKTTTYSSNQRKRPHIPNHERSLSMDGGLLTSRDHPLLPTPPPSRHDSRHRGISSVDRPLYSHPNYQQQPDLRSELNRNHHHLYDFPRNPLPLNPSPSHKRTIDHYDGNYSNRQTVSPLVNHQRMTDHAHLLPHPFHDQLERRHSDYSRSSQRPNYHDTPPPSKRMRTNGEDYGMVSARGFRGSGHHYHHRRNSSRY